MLLAGEYILLCGSLPIPTAIEVEKFTADPAAVLSATAMTTTMTTKPLETATSWELEVVLRLANTLSSIFYLCLTAILSAILPWGLRHGWMGEQTLQSTDKRLRRMTPDGRTIEEEPGRGRNERTPLPTTTKTTITKTHPGNRNRDGDGHGTVATSVSAFVSATIDGRHQEAVWRNWWRMIMMRKWEQMWVQ